MRYIDAQTYCNSCTFPRVLGGSQGDTIIRSIDSDANENILVAGISYDTSLVGSLQDSNSFKPFIGYLSACEYQWLNTIDSLEGYDISTAKLNNDGTLAAFSTDVKNDQHLKIILRTSDGTKVFTYEKCHSSTYNTGRTAALSLGIYGPESDYVMFSAEPSSTDIIFCKYTPSGI